MIKMRLPKSFDLLLFWHGLFAGSYTIAYLTAEGAPALHQFAGYAAIGLLVLRLLMAIVVAERSPWALPWPCCRPPWRPRSSSTFLAITSPCTTWQGR